VDSSDGLACYGNGGIMVALVLNVIVHRDTAEYRVQVTKESGVVSPTFQELKKDVWPWHQYVHGRQIKGFICMAVSFDAITWVDLSGTRWKNNTKGKLQHYYSG
jgi:hypothetical protein